MPTFLILLLSLLSYFYLDPILALYCIAPSWLEAGSKYVSMLFAPFHLLLTSMLLLIGSLLIKKYNRFRINCLFLFVTINLTMFIVGCLKMIARRPRPYVYLNEGLYGFFLGDIGSDFLSFPSSHAAVSMLLATLLASIFPNYKKVIFGVTAPIILMRIVLQEHFMSDILIGSLIGYGVAKGSLKMKKLLETRSFMPLKQK